MGTMSPVGVNTTGFLIKGVDSDIIQSVFFNSRFV